jgi:hypothetical protein
MTRQAETSDMAERLRIVERALAEATAQIGELANAIAEMADITGLSDPASTQPLTINADDITPFAVGFYQREFDTADRPYRWTGKGSFFELRVRISRNFEWPFIMELQRNRHVNISKLRGYVDYMEIPVQANEADGYIRGIIPSKPFGSSAILTFQLPNLFAPKQIDPDSADNRTLGVVFYEIRAEPGVSAAKNFPLAVAHSTGRAVSSLRGHAAEASSGSVGGNTPEAPAKSRRSFAASVSRLKLSL